METEGLGNSIFIDFGSILEPSWASKTEPRRSKIDVEKASKFDQFLKASWKAIFSTQEAPRRENAVFRRRRWSRPGPGGGGFRRGKPGPQAPRTFESRGMRKKRAETWIAIPHADPGWAAD